MAVEQRIGRINSGDVSLFYRAYGTPGRTPILILHGSNYYDSYDWIGVSSGLAHDRQVVVFDHRGFGHSGWSEYKDYSLDALFSDIINVSAHFGWKRPAIMGHSMSGRLAIFFAAYFPDHLSQLIVADTAMGKGNPGKQKTVGKLGRRRGLSAPQAHPQPRKKRGKDDDEQRLDRLEPA